MKPLFWSAFLWAIWASSNAAFYSGADLRRFIEAGEAVKQGQMGAAPVNAGVYAGYLAGITESFYGVYYCPPEGTPLQDMAAVVTTYVRSHPDRQEQSAQSLIVKALGIAYPCSIMDSPQ